MWFYIAYFDNILTCRYSILLSTCIHVRIYVLYMCTCACNILTVLFIILIHTLYILIDIKQFPFWAGRCTGTNHPFLNQEIFDSEMTLRWRFPYVFRQILLHFLKTLEKVFKSLAKGLKVTDQMIEWKNVNVAVLVLYFLICVK